MGFVTVSGYHAHLAEGLRPANSLRRWREKRTLRRLEVQIGNVGDSDSAAIKLI